MERILRIHGNVMYQITIDPSVWIFDDRKLDLTTYFTETSVEVDDLQEYTEKMAKQWDKEIKEGAPLPNAKKPEKKFEKEVLLTGTFGMPLRPFLIHAEPHLEASTLVIETEEGDIVIAINDGMELILGFSKEGKPLNEDGPVHVYYKDGSNQASPIKNVRGFKVV